MKKVYIGSDHAGFQMKERVKEALNEKYEFVDVGTHSDEAADYPIYAEKVANAVAADPNAQGVLLCGNGVGIAIAANKVPGIRAALAFSKASAASARQHNDANVVTTAGREELKEDPVDLVDTFLSTDFSGEERHVRRVEQMKAIEEKHLKK
ncbi:RpiB/LacA/LacB family sugar-phosphate isomerase [Candidatus Peregrinibacteria bacterium]|nr:MAG: RpiB/LacA/LacB family sugar-phosphate isomerase [Candidatus Peregrinibacteria bacterium]